MAVPSDSLCLLGAFQLVCQGKPVVFDQPRLEELIALLAIQPGEPIQRVQIAYQIWPDSGESQARANLRNLLYKLKQLWPNMDTAIAVERNHVTWRSDACIAVDLLRFQSLIADAGRCDNADDRIKLLTDAVDLYRGDFLPTCFADWALVERERLRGRYTTLLEQLVDLLLVQRRYADALQRAKALQRFDPLHESAYRCLMQTYAALGDRAAALRVYHTCASTLQQELGVEPSPATEALRTQLLHLKTQATTPDAPQAVQRQRLVGRHDEWRQFQETWRYVQQGSPQCILIWGEAGIGKTRLAEEMIDWVERQGLSAASSRSYAVGGALTYAPIAEWLRSTSIRPLLETIDDLWLVEIARLLPDLLTNRPDLPHPGPMTETWQQQRFFQSIVHALKAAPTPLLLHLDDLQWSESETLTLLQFLLHGASSHPLLLVGGIRSEDAGGNQALAAFLEATRHAGQLVELRLGPLSVEEVTELAAQTTGEAIDADIADALYATSEGHPLYLIEAVRGGLVEPQSRVENSEQTVSDLRRVTTIPLRVYNLLAARLEQLSESARQVASLAAVIGRAFDYEILVTAVSLDEMALIDALDELWSRRIIREQTGDSYDFSHDRIREVAYQEISRARRRLYHRQVAAALEAIHGDDLDSVAGELAAHYAQVGDLEAAYCYYRRAAEVALAQHALPYAETMLDAALRFVSNNPERRVSLLHVQDDIFGRSLQFDRWAENLDEEAMLLKSMDMASPRLVLAHELSRSRYFSTVVEGSEAVTAALAAIAVAEKIGDKVALAHGYLELGNGYWIQTRLSESAQAYGQSARLAREAGAIELEAAGLQLQAEPGMFTGMPAADIHDLLSRALTISESTDNKQDLPDIVGKLGYWRVTLGMGGFDKAEQDYRRGLNVAREIGHRLHEEMVLSNLGVLFTHKGDYRQAAEALQAAIELGHGDARFWRYWVAHHHRGACMMEAGRLDAAFEDLMIAGKQLRSLGNRHYEVKARCDLGLVYHLVGDHSQALSELKLALTLLDGYGDLRFEALANTRLGYVLEAMGQLAEGATCYKRGRHLHDQMGQHYYAMNALSGLARIAALQGDHDAAFGLVVTVWETIGGQEMDATIETARTLRTCFAIIRHHGDSRADAVFKMALGQLQQRASTIDDPDHIDQFWRIEDHRFFQRVNDAG